MKICKDIEHFKGVSHQMEAMVLGEDSGQGGGGRYGVHFSSSSDR